jgi:hypothetical protein
MVPDGVMVEVASLELPGANDGFGYDRVQIGLTLKSDGISGWSPTDQRTVGPLGWMRDLTFYRDGTTLAEANYEAPITYDNYWQLNWSPGLCIPVTTSNVYVEVKELDTFTADEEYGTFLVFDGLYPGSRLKTKIESRLPYEFLQEISCDVDGVDEGCSEVFYDPYIGGSTYNEYWQYDPNKHFYTGSRWKAGIKLTPCFTY